MRQTYGSDAFWWLLCCLLAFGPLLLVALQNGVIRPPAEIGSEVIE